MRSIGIAALLAYFTSTNLVGCIAITTRKNQSNLMNFPFIRSIFCKVKAKGNSTSVKRFSQRRFNTSVVEDTDTGFEMVETKVLDCLMTD